MITLPFPRVDAPEYSTPARRGWRGYNRQVCVASVLHPRDGAALLKRHMPGTSRDAHEALATIHARRAMRHRIAYELALDKAAQETFGRPFGFHDYKISAIGSDAFSDHMKDKLRRHAHAKRLRSDLAEAHFMAAGRQLQTALRLRREIGVIVFFLQIDTVAPKNTKHDNHLQNSLFSSLRPFHAD